MEEKEEGEEGEEEEGAENELVGKQHNYSQAGEKETYHIYQIDGHNIVSSLTSSEEESETILKVTIIILQKMNWKTVMKVLLKMKRKVRRKVKQNVKQKAILRFLTFQWL